MPEVETEVSVTVNVEVYCAKCGAGLCGQTETGRTRMRGDPFFRVAPCEKCLADEREEGRNEGYEEGRSHEGD